MRRTDEIFPLEKPIHNCLIGAICIFSQWYSGRYEYLLSSCWYFKFNVNNGRTHWETESFDESEVRALLKLGGRADYIWHEKPVFHASLAVIREELARNMPIGFVFDAYFCPWSTVYQQEHVYHFLLVTDITSEGYILCVDNISDMVVEISPEQFSCGFGRYITFHNVEQVSRLGVEDLLTYLKMHFFTSDRERMFDDLRSLATFLQNMNIGSELLSYSLLEGAPLLRMFRFLEGGKLHFGEFISWVYRLTGWEWCSDLAETMLSLAKEWNAAKGLLIKAAYVENPDYQLHRLSRKVLELTTSEEEIFLQFRRQLDTLGSP